MLSPRQQKVVDCNNITARKLETGEYVFLVYGSQISQTPSPTQSGALKKGIGYVMEQLKKKRR